MTSDDRATCENVLATINGYYHEFGYGMCYVDVREAVRLQDDVLCVVLAILEAEGSIVRNHDGDYFPVDEPSCDYCGDTGCDECDEDFDERDKIYGDYDGQPDEAQEWHDFDPDC